MRLPILAFSLTLVPPAAAQLTTFTDFASWTATAGSPTSTESFDSFLFDEDFNDIPASLTFGTMNAVGGSTQNFRNVIDVPPFQFKNINGTNCVSGFVNGAATALPYVQIELDLGGPASAFAFSYDYGTIAEGLAIDFSSGGTVLGSVDVTAAFPSIGFLGVTSGQSFDLIIFRTTAPSAGSGGEGFAFDDVLVVGGGGNGLGMRYCSPGNPNSTGQPSMIVANGTSVVAQNNLVLEGRSLPVSAFGFFITSQTQGFVANPNGSQGNLCLGGAIGRYVGPGQILNSGAMGTFSLALDLTQTPQPSGFVSVMGGQTWSFQAWHRDSAMGMATSNFTDAVAISFL